MPPVLPTVCLVAACALVSPRGAAQTTSPSSAAPAWVRAESGDSSWVIGNALIERQIAFGRTEAGGPALRTVAWRHRVSGTDYMAHARARALGGGEVELSVDGVRVTNPGMLQLVGARRDVAPDGNARLVVTLRAGAPALAVEVTYDVPAAHAAVRQWVTITNEGPHPIVLSHLTIANLVAAPAPPEVMVLDGFYGAFPRESFYTGRVDDAALTLRDPRSGEGMVVINEAPGHLKRTESMGLATWGGGVQVMYDTDLFPFERRLAPGERWTSAAATVVFFHDGRAGRTARDVVPAYASQQRNAHRRAAGPLVLFDTWEPFNQAIDEPLMRALILRAARMGADVFVIDEGWEWRLGDNTPDPDRFPHGIDSLRDVVERNGMRLGLWAPLAATDTLAPVFRAHPEWAMRGADGRLKLTTIAGGHSVAVMDLASPYRYAAIARLDSLVRRYRPRYVKLDLTTAFNSYGESPGCHAPGHDHATWAESLVRIYEGIAEVTGALRRAHPDLLVDISFEAWGQKHVIDHGLLAAGDMDWISNVEDAAPNGGGSRGVRQLLYHRSLVAPAEAMLIGNLRAEIAPAAERVATAFGSTPLFLGDLRRANDATLDWMGAQFRWYKALRRALPLDDRFHPLGAWQQPRADRWDGFARLSVDGEGIVALFRNDSDSRRIHVALPLTSGVLYDVRSVFDGRALGRFDGKTLARGLSVDFGAPRAPGGAVDPIDRGTGRVIVLEVRRASGAAKERSKRG